MQETHIGLETSLDPLTTRRFFFKQCIVGLGKITFTSLLGADLCQRVAATEQSDPMARGMPHFQAKAKQVLFLLMAGGPSHLELFDYKPTLRSRYAFQLCLTRSSNDAER